MLHRLKPSIGLWLVLPLLWLPTGCALEKQSNAQPSGVRPGSGEERPPLVDIATATFTDVAIAPSYTGTTTPLKTVALRSRVEGQLISLVVDIGDTVTQGQAIARLDQALLQAEYNEAVAELASRKFEVREAQAELAEVKAEVEVARAELQQATADASRLKSLTDSGAVSVQAGEVAATEEATATKVLQSIKEQVKTRQEAIAAAEGRVIAQQAIINQVAERLSYTSLNAPFSGFVLSKNIEAGDLIQPGQDLLEIGDLSGIHIEIQISDRELSQFSLGQAVTVSLDAFPGETFPGKVTRISPVADAAARLIPIEITIDNPGQKISSGLLARVTTAGSTSQKLTIPASALQKQADQDIIFIAQKQEEDFILEARPIQIGSQDNGFVEVRSGLIPGDRYVVKGDRPLEAGQVVRASLLSD